MPLLLPSNILYHGSPWESLIRRGGHCACDQSGQLLGSLRNKYVLNAHRENNPCKRNRSHTVHDTCFVFFLERELGLTLRQVQPENGIYFFFYRMKNCFDSHGSSAACSAVQRIHRNPKSVYPTALLYWNQTQNDAQTSRSSFYGKKPVTNDCSATAHSCGGEVSDRP